MKNGSEEWKQPRRLHLLFPPQGGESQPSASEAEERGSHGEEALRRTVLFALAQRTS
jgi:hypothetical protein